MFISIYLYLNKAPFERIPGREKTIANKFPFDAIIKGREKGDMFPGNIILEIKKLITDNIK